MPSFKIAHVNHQGLNLILVPLGPSFGRKTPEEQKATADELQVRASAAGLAGAVVPVWDAGGGHMGFLAPRKCHPLLRQLSLRRVYQMVNRELAG